MSKRKNYVITVNVEQTGSKSFSAAAQIGTSAVHFGSATSEEVAISRAVLSLCREQKIEAPVTPTNVVPYPGLPDAPKQLGKTQRLVEIPFTVKKADPTETGRVKAIKPAYKGTVLAGMTGSIIRLSTKNEDVAVVFDGILNRSTNDGSFWMHRNEIAAIPA